MTLNTPLSDLRSGSLTSCLLSSHLLGYTQSILTLWTEAEDSEGQDLFSCDALPLKYPPCRCLPYVDASSPRLYKKKSMIFLSINFILKILCNWLYLISSTNPQKDFMLSVWTIPATLVEFIDLPPFFVFLSDFIYRKNLCMLQCCFNSMVVLVYFNIYF